MVIFHIAGFLILILMIARKFECHVLEAFPVGTSLMVLMLYVLAFFGALSFSDWIAAGNLHVQDPERKKKGNA